MGHDKDRVQEIEHKKEIELRDRPCLIQPCTPFAIAFSTFNRVASSAIWHRGRKEGRVPLYTGIFDSPFLRVICPDGAFHMQGRGVEDSLDLGRRTLRVPYMLYTFKSYGIPQAQEERVPSTRICFTLARPGNTTSTGTKKVYDRLLFSFFPSLRCPRSFLSVLFVCGPSPLVLGGVFWVVLSKAC